MDDQNELRVELLEGMISNTKADVIVNSTNRDLKLNIGVLSKSILQGAGQDIQTECSEKYPHGLAWGEIAVTGGYNLSCKRVYHGVLPAWDTDEKGVDPKDVLSLLVNACLEQADSDRVTSIAFPSLGCGFLNFPHNEVAMTICQCIAIFKSMREKTSLKLIYIVIYNKGQDWKHIRQAFRQELGIQPAQEQQSWSNMFGNMLKVPRFGTKEQKAAPVQNRAHRFPERAIERTHAITDHGRPAKPPRVQNPFLDTCMRESAKNGCKQILQCRHICGGVKDESRCPPCLQKNCHGHAALTQAADDNCSICHTDNLSAAPVIMLTCGHLFHFHCVKRILDNKWVGPRITFNFMNCPLCKEAIEHPLLAEKMAPLVKTRDDVKQKALMRLQYEGLDKADEISSQTSPYYKKPAEFAMERYCYYPCYKCKKAYFGGVVQCEQGAGDGEFDLKDLICPACSNPNPEQVCKTHGTSFLEYKCRYCCSIAVFFCFGTTHFCNECHDNVSVVTSKPVNQLPKCPAGPAGKQLVGKCPLNVKHPATGEEFSLGCGICINAQTF